MGDIFPFSTPYNTLLDSKQKGAGYTLAHEWGHYYYGLYDEYKGKDTSQNNCTGCPHTDDVPVTNSAMNSQWQAVNGDFAWLNFSVPKHNTQKTAQYRMYHASGWETLARSPSLDPRNKLQSAGTWRLYYPELADVAPGSNQEASIQLPDVQARSHLNVSWDPASQRGTADEMYQASINAIFGNEAVYPNPVVLIAQVSKTDPIADAEITAYATAPGNSNLQLSLKDDGVMPDVTANDGYYSGLLPYNRNGAYQVLVTFTNNSGNAKFTQIAYHHSPGPNGESPDLTPQPVGENFSAVAAAVIVVTNFADDDHGSNIGGATLLPTDNTDIPGRIDSAGDVDMFKVDTAGSHILRVTNLALDMQPRIRLLDANGNETAQFTPSVSDSNYFYTPLTVVAGQPVYISISHASSTAVDGMYNISIGSALAAEDAESDTNAIYLPLVIK